MGISLRQLEVFVSIIQNNNVTRASKYLKLSQSAVSMALSELEKQLGERLFDRVGKRLILNESGKILLPKAIEIISRIKEVKILFKEGINELSGELKIGASATVGNYTLPKIISQYVTTHSKVRILLDIKNTDEIINSIINFNIDFAIVEGFCQRKELNVVPWKKDLMVIIAQKNHPLTKKKQVSLQELAQQRWILREVGAGPREFFESSIAGKIKKIDIFLELGNTEAIKHTVQEGIGIACVSHSTIIESLKRKELAIINTPHLNLERYFHMITHKEKYKTTLLNSFIKTCELNC
jgi:DNA-binding transcriptional LysR family regulator